LKTLVIAEAGVNHNGDFAMAKRLVDVAADAGADVVKFQTFSAKRLVTSVAPKAAYQKKTTDAEETQLDMLRRLELSEQAHIELIEHCRQKGIAFLSTGFDIASVDMLVALGVTLFKIPSGEITNLPYLRHIGGLGGDVLLSTGMANLGEVEAALDVLEATGTPRARITVLHCTTDYPADIDAVNLRAMTSMGSALGVKVGYSDHTEGIEISIAAVALGATVIEKHITLDRTLPGPDQKASIEPHELRAMLSGIRNVERALGDGVKRVTPAEVHNIPIVRKSIVANAPIRAGEAYTALNIVAMRPGTGVSPMRWDEVVGRIAARDYNPGELIEL
jgi:N,N'-diacetyllegionaminate synthase